MHNTCAKHVDLRGIHYRKTSARLSTVRHTNALKSLAARVKALVVTIFIPRFPLILSPANSSAPPLTEHTFYPVSTAPTNNYNQINKKER